MDVAWDALKQSRFGFKFLKKSLVGSRIIQNRGVYLGLNSACLGPRLEVTPQALRFGFLDLAGGRFVVDKKLMAFPVMSLFPFKIQFAWISAEHESALDSS